jgi:excisionase family DNA binding protein
MLPRGKKMIINEPTMTIKQVAKEAQVSGQTVRTWIKSGFLKTWKVGSRYRISVASLNQLAKQCN